MKNIYNRIGGRILELRKTKGLSREGFSKKLGIHVNSLRNYELGKRQPDFNLIEKIINIYKIPIDYFFENGSKLIQYPFLSKITRGEPILSNRNIKGVKTLNNLFPRGKQYCLIKVKDNSLKDRGINKNDLVLINIEKKELKEKEVYAVAVFENSKKETEIILRTVINKGNMIALISANLNYEPQLYKKIDVQIIGKVITVIKRINQS
jgi:SOS-response transcriptional repressor LexA